MKTNRLGSVMVGLLVLSACGPGNVMVVPLDPPPAPVVISGVAAEGTRLSRNATGSTVQAVYRMGAGAAALVGGELKAVSASGALTAVPVGAAGEVMSTGAIAAISTRGQGLLVRAANGLFHDADGRLLRSPLSDSIELSTLAEVQTFGSGAAEELWLRHADGALSRVKNGKKTDVSFSLNGATVTGIVSVIPAGAGRALVATSTKEVFRVDLAASTIKRVAVDVGSIAVTATENDGTAHLGTDKGLLTVKADDSVTLTTFAAEGSPGKIINDLNAIDGELWVVTDGHLLQRISGAFSIVQDVATATVRSVTRTAAGEVLLVDGSALFTSKPPVSSGPSFATEVKPFLIAECTQACHATGANYAPIRRYDDYTTAKASAALLVTRVTNSNQAGPMPPSSYKTLNAADYAVLIQWAQGGQLP